MTLREMSRDDLDFVSAMLADADVMRFFGGPYTREEAGGWIDRQLQRYGQDGHGYWLVVDRNTRRPVGQVGLLAVELDGEREPTIGYMIDRPFWGRGYATEAAAATCRYAFETLGHDRVATLIRPANADSQAVARKLGMHAERTTEFQGYEHVLYVLPREDWEAARRAPPRP